MSLKWSSLCHQNALNAAFHSDFFPYCFLLHPGSFQAGILLALTSFTCSHPRLCMVLFSWNSLPMLSTWLTLSHSWRLSSDISLPKLPTLTTGNWDLPASPQDFMSILTHDVSSFSSFHLCSKVKWDFFSHLAYCLLSVPLFKREKIVVGLKINKTVNS